MNELCIKELENEKSSISIIIPSCPGHLKHIPDLLKEYTTQTYLPLEIILVLSQIMEADNELISELEIQKLPFNFKIIKLEETNPAGKNRLIGSKEAKGDIIIFQDADDLPHFQRNEIIEKCFRENPEIVHVVHGFSSAPVKTVFNLEDLPFEIMNKNKFGGGFLITHGNIAIRTSIIDKIMWDTTSFRGQDVRLNQNIFKVFKKFLRIMLPLYCYRSRLSSRNFKKKNIISPPIPSRIMQKSESELTEAQLDYLKDNNFLYGKKCYNLQLPWISPQAIMFLLDKINKDTKVLEFGSGGSTLFFANRVKEVVTFESDKKWFNTVSNSKKDETLAKIKYNWVDRQEILIEEIEKLPNNYFDLVLIDIGVSLSGRNREELFFKCIPKMSKNAIYILDNGLSRKHFFNIYKYQLNDFQKLIGTQYTLKDFDDRTNLFLYACTRILIPANLK